MKSLSCADLGDASCHFVAEGQTDEEVLGKMKSHVTEVHPDKMTEMAKTMTEDQIMEMMKSKIKAV